MESEESETLHLSSLSWLGELEVGGGQEEETLTQRFTRLRCEATELTEELDSLTESAREDSLAGLHRQVAQLRQQLDGCDLVSEGTAGSTQLTGQKAVLDELSAQIKNLALTGSPDAPVGSFELYVRGGSHSAGGTAASLPELDRRLARLEALVGSISPDQRRVLSAETDGLALSSAVQLLSQRRYVQTGQHLTHIEGRLAALNNRLDALGQQKSLVQRAKSASQVAALYDALESRAGLVAVLPEVATRLADLAQLQQGADGWSSRLADTSAKQEAADKVGISRSLNCFDHVMRLIQCCGMRIRIMLIRIRTQDLKKFVTDPDPDRTLIQIRIQAKTIQVRIQAKNVQYQENLKNRFSETLISHALCVYKNYIK